MSLAHAQRRENAVHSSELQKTSGEKAAIALADDVLKIMFADLDIPEIPELRPDRFHVMSDEWFGKNKKGIRGAFHSFEDKIVLRRNQTEGPVQLYKTIFHEAVHSVSRITHRVNDEKKVIHEYRVGYAITNTFHDDDVHAHLRGFNEGVVETIVEEMFHENKREIQQILRVPDRDFEEAIFAYPLFRSVVKTLCIGVAQAQKGKPRDIWQKIKRGQFTGDMMHLRDVEFAYGKGALRVLDALQLGLNETLEAQDVVDEKNSKILQYFESYNADGVDKQETRARLSLEILGLEAYKKYCI